MSTSTFFALMAEFGTANIPLADVCEKYFSLSEPRARRSAKTQELPIPVFRCTESQKCTYMISALDLAEHIDKQRAEARRDHDRMHSTAAA